MAAKRRFQLRSAALGALLVAVSSQISIHLFTEDFKISVAIILLPTFAFLLPDFPLVMTALLSAPGVFLLRTVVAFLPDGVFPATPWTAYGPELLFYTSYGLMLALYVHHVSLHPYQLVKYLPLILIDAAANFLELSVRLGTGVFEPSVLLRLLLVGVSRALLAAAVLRALDYYGFQVLRREDAERYRRLLLLTASLKGEVAWMDKGTALVENTMSAAYQLYSQLRRAKSDPALTDAALNIAKDIHEVKKGYFLIMRGISETLDAEASQNGMWLNDLFFYMGAGVARMAESTGKLVAFTSSQEDNFHTLRHHYLMSILHNLLSNAVEAAKTGEQVRLTLSQRSVGDTYHFTVQDTCGGITEEQLGQIFMAGFSNKLNRETGEVNRGLGLCIVKDLVEEKLGGTIQVDSRDGSTTFIIILPKSGLEDGTHEILPC